MLRGRKREFPKTIVDGTGNGDFGRDGESSREEERGGVKIFEGEGSSEGEDGDFGEEIRESQGL